MRIALLALVFLCGLSSQPANARDETIFVVQPTTMGLAKRFEAVLSGAYNLNNRYVGEAGVLLSLLYYPRENFAVELQGGWFAWRYNTDFFQRLSAAGGDFGTTLVEYYRVPWLATVNLQWSPIYGKMTFHNLFLADFGFYVLAGAGVVGLELANPAAGATVAPVFTGPSVLPLQLTTPFGAGIRLHFANHFGVRVEIRDNVQALWTRTIDTYQSSFNISHKTWLTLGVSYVF